MIRSSNRHSRAGGNPALRHSRAGGKPVRTRTSLYSRLRGNDGRGDDLTEFVKLQKKFADSDKSWTVDVKDIDPTTFDLSVKNPNGGEEVVHRSPQEIMDEIAALDEESSEVLQAIRGLL